MPSAPTILPVETTSTWEFAENSENLPGGIIIAEQLTRLKRALNAILTFLRRATAALLPLLSLSKYGLGVALILCVTVIWVASSEWIQYIFGSLDYNKPFFLTYFNTTGFCLWNAGYLLLPRWRRTPWDEASRAQPICVEDERLGSTPDDHVDVMIDEDEEVETIDEAPLRISNTPDAVRLPESHAALATPTPGVIPPRPPRTWAPSLSPPPTAQLPFSLTHVHHTLQESGDGRWPAPSAPPRPNPVHLAMADECRDYSLPASRASSAQEEVLDVWWCDNDDDTMPWTSRGGEGPRDTLDGAPPAPPSPGGAVQHVRVRARRPRVLRYSQRRIWTCALYFCPLWFLANYLFNLSLSITSVASNTILSSTSSIWTLLLSYVLLRQQVGVHRLVAVALCVGGSIMVGMADRGGASGTNTAGGDVVALLSAFFYAAYTSVLKLHLPEDERFAMGMVFGAVGVLNFFLMWPGLVVLSVTGAEPFALPTWQQFWPLLLNALIGTNLSDVLWARSVVLTSPVVATLGLSLTTPLAMIVDALFKGAHFNGLYIAGAVLVMVGFLLANLPIRLNISL